MVVVEEEERREASVRPPGPAPRMAILSVGEDIVLGVLCCVVFCCVLLCLCDIAEGSERFEL